MTTNKEIIKQVLEHCLYLKGMSYMCDEDRTIFWNNWELLYETKYQGNQNCQECQRNELKRMIIDTCDK